MSEPTDTDADVPTPEWYERLRGDLERCATRRDVLALRSIASDWEAVARHKGNELEEDLAVSLQRDAVQRGADLHDAKLLRDVFAWRPLPIANNHGGLPVCYAMRVIGAPDVEVARLSRKGGNEDWQATLDQHRPWERRPMRDCTSYEAGRLGVELWAARRFARLQGEARAMLAGFPSGSWDECRAPGCTRGGRLLCDACAVPVAWKEPAPERGEEEAAEGPQARAQDARQGTPPSDAVV